MSIKKSHSGAPRRAARPRNRATAPLALAAALLIGGTETAAAESVVAEAAAADAAAGQAEAAQPSRWELLVSSGSLVPAAHDRDGIKRANLTAAQVSYVVRPDLAITASLGWARSRDTTAAGEPRLDVFTYDVGAEYRPVRWRAGRAVSFSPFAGMGAGGRSYNYHSLDVDAAHNLAGYVSAGGEVGIRQVRLRLEVRDYVTGFKPLHGGSSSGSRNDVVAMIGLRYVRPLR